MTGQVIALPLIDMRPCVTPAEHSDQLEGADIDCPNPAHWCEVITMPRTPADLARERLQAALDEYKQTSPAAAMTESSRAFARWCTDTAARYGCDPAEAHRLWQATMLGLISQAARTYLEETA